MSTRGIGDYKGPVVSLELLRAENAKLEKQIFNFALTRLGILLIVLFIFAGVALHHDQNSADAILSKMADLARSKDRPLPALDPMTLYVSNPAFGDDQTAFGPLLANLKISNPKC